MTTKFLNLQQVLDITGRTKSTLYRWMDEGKFPKPYHLNKTSTSYSCGWANDEVQKWIDAIKS
jgi:prophage regulatory protein